MKRFIALVALTLFAATGHAQTTSNSGASSQSQTHVQASQGNLQTITVTAAAQPANQTESVHYSGADRQAPAVVTGGFAAGFSSDNCMNTAQAGISTPVGSAAFGGPTADQNCQAMRRVDAHNRVASGYFAVGDKGRAVQQLDQAAIDLCIADARYAPADCTTSNTTKN